MGREKSQALEVEAGSCVPGRKKSRKKLFSNLACTQPRELGDLATEGCDKKEPYQGGTLTPQSTLPDAAQPVGTGTVGEKQESLDISTIIQAAALGHCSSDYQSPDEDTKEEHHAMSHLAAPQHLAQVA